MKHKYHPSLSVILFMTIVLAAYIANPGELSAFQHPPVTDFVAPMTSGEAQARIAAAHRDPDRSHNDVTQSLHAASTPSLPFVQTLYISQSGHHISNRAGFLAFWREHGSTLTFGYPISEEIVEDGRIVQYFERARFEFHPERLERSAQVQLSLLGRIVTVGRTFPDGEPTEGSLYFLETKHTLSGKFLTFWQKRGGLAIFGYPISEPLEEISPDDGQPRLTQYFERARFEYHPEDMDTFYRQEEQTLHLQLATLHEIRLTNLGQQVAQRNGQTFLRSTQIHGTLDWSPRNWQRRIDVDLTAQALIAYEDDTPVYHALVATGRDGFNTPVGSFTIYSKYPIQTMTGSVGDESWYVPNIPWVQYIVGGVAFHGTYWHDGWGTGLRLSHGCVNLNIDDAEWLYEWADIGTIVDIHY